MSATDETLRLLERVTRLAREEQAGMALSIRRVELRLIDEALDGVVDAYIARGESLVEPEVEQAVALRMRHIGGAA